MADKSKFFDALMKTRYGDTLKKSMKKKAKKLPLSLKALGLGAAAYKWSKNPDIKYEKKVGKSGKFMIKANPKKKSIGLWYKKSF